MKTSEEYKYAIHMNCKLETFRKEFRRYYKAVKEIEEEFNLQPKEKINIDKFKKD